MMNWKIGGILFILAVEFAGGANAQVYTGTKIHSNGSLDNYHLSIGNYFNVSENKILDSDKKITLQEELPVVFFMAQKSGKEPRVIAGLRADGMSWMKMAKHFNLGPRVFYVPIMGNPRSPYKKIYKSYQGHKSRIQLSDADIVNLVNLKFISDHHGRDPQEIILMRSKGNTFPDINDTFKEEKDDMNWDAEGTPLEVRDSKGRPDPRKGDRNSLNPIERQKNR